MVIGKSNPSDITSSKYSSCKGNVESIDLLLKKLISILKAYKIFHKIQIIQYIHRFILKKVKKRAMSGFEPLALRL